MDLARDQTDPERLLAGKHRLEIADTIIWLDLPLHSLLRRLWWRTSSRIRDNVELWNGNRESWRTALWGGESLFVWMIRSCFHHRREWPRRLGSHPGFVRLRSPEAARRWIEQYT